MNFIIFLKVKNLRKGFFKGFEDDVLRDKKVTIYSYAENASSFKKGIKYSENWVII
jgi:hypothetical protein